MNILDDIYFWLFYRTPLNKLDTFMPSLQEGQTAGGGEILLVGDREDAWKFYNKQLIYILQYYSWMKLGICILIVLIAIIIFLKLIGITSVNQNRSIRAELDNVHNIRKNELKIIRKQYIYSKLKDLSHKFGLDPDYNYINYMNYNLKRAGIRDATGDGYLDALTYNALIKAGTISTSLLCVLYILKSPAIGTILLVVTLIGWSIIPNSVIRSIALKKDNIIKDNFFDFYAELHYILREGGDTPLSKVIRSYAKSSSDKPDMQIFADNCADLFDLYGEYEGTNYIAREYREIPEVTKLMRLVRQFHDNADIKAELDGFRAQLMTQLQLRIEARQEKLIKRARMSFNILTIILVQAILSAMAIYLPDLTGGFM